MASTSIARAPSFSHFSSSSSFRPDSPWKYEVFLSFHGKDTRNSFTDHLHREFERNGIIVFRDDREMERGEPINKELFKAIEESLYAVVVISENYVFSKWCLWELTKIMERKSEKRLKVFPVFYNVDPSDVRNLRGSFETALDQHRERGVHKQEVHWFSLALRHVGSCTLHPANIQLPRVRFDPEVETWRSTFTRLGFLAGWHVHNRSESTVIEEIVKTVLEGLMRNLPEVPNFVVGMESPLNEMWKLLDIGSDDVRYVGICGMSGVGKTTLARVIYERVSSQFTARCFVHGIGEASGRDLVPKQEYLISKILTGTVASTLDCFDTNLGIQVLSSRLRRKRVFIVLDDVCQKEHIQREQIGALAGSPDWFGRGSRIIFTSTTRHLLHDNIYNIYEVKELNNADALSLFSHNAFHKRPEKVSAKHSQRQSEEQPAEPHPENEFAEFIQDIVDCAQGLPLALQIFGSYLSLVKEKKIWESYLERLKANLHEDILKKLKVTFDGLDNVAQDVFMDIACFFNGWHEDMVKSKLNSLVGNSSESILLDLEQRCLVKFSKDRQLFMHDLLAKMGKEIAGHSRLWCPEDIDSILCKETGLGEVKSIFLKPCSVTTDFYYEALSAMQNLKMFWIETPSEDEDRGLRVDYQLSRKLNWLAESLKFILNCLRREDSSWKDKSLKFRPSNDLLVLGWEKCPLTTLPLLRSPNLVELSLRHSNILTLWEGNKNLFQLKHIDMSFSLKLIKIPNLGAFQKLEILNLSFCKRLYAVNSIECLSNLRKLLLQGCDNLVQLPETLSSTSLEVLDLSGCSKLKMFPDISSSSACVRNLDISWTKIQELPPLEVRFSSLEKFHANGAYIRELPSHIVSSEKLKDLSLCFNSSISFQHPTFSTLRFLEVLKLHSCNISNQGNPLDLSRLISLKDLDLSNNKLVRPPDSLLQIHRLQKLSLSGCKNLQMSDDLFWTLNKALSELSLSHCYLQEMIIPHNSGFWSSISSLDLSYNMFMELPDSMHYLSNLDKLILTGCSILRTLPKLPLKLHSLNLRECRELKAFGRQNTAQISRDTLQTSVCSFTVAYIDFGGLPHKILYLHPESPPYKDHNDYLIECMVACGPTLGPEISKSFIQRGTSSNGRVQISADWKLEDGLSGPLACVLLIGYEVQGHDQMFPEFVCQIQLNEEDSKQTLLLSIPKVTCVGPHGIWVFINIPDSLQVPESMESWRYLFLITAEGENVELKECGVRLLGVDADFVSSISEPDLDYGSLDLSLNRFLFVTGRIK